MRLTSGRRLPLTQLLLVVVAATTTTFTSRASAWTSRSFVVPTRSTRVISNPRTNLPTRLPFGVVGRVGRGRVAVAYQVGDLYDEHNSREEEEDADTDAGDFHSNTFGDVLEEEEEEENETDPDSSSILDYAFAGDYEEEADENAAHTIFPFLDHWRLMTTTSGEDGSDDSSHCVCIAGIVSNHPRYPCGEAIVTSPLDFSSSEDCAPEAIVSTVTGSHYLLGPHLLKLQLDDWVVTEEGHVQGTVVLATSSGSEDTKAEQVVSSLGALLVDIQGQEITTSQIVSPSMRTDNDHALLRQSMSITTASGSRYILGAPRTYPLLSEWKRLEGGSIAGIVSRHELIPDGELMTTSPLVELDESHDGIVLVTTESGSQYQLGDAEPTKEELWQQQQAEAGAMEVATMGEEETDASSDNILLAEEEHDDDEIRTNHIPHPPPTNPLLHLEELEEQIALEVFNHKNDTEGIVVGGERNRTWNQTAWDHSY